MSNGDTAATSNTDDGDDYGVEAVTATPPIDALATVTIHGDPVTTLSVPSGSTLAIHTERKEGDGEVDTDDVPPPAYTGDLAETDPHDSFDLSRTSWVTVTADGTRRLRVAAAAGNTVAVFLERAETYDEVDA